MTPLSLTAYITIDENVVVFLAPLQIAQGSGARNVSANS
jgi:hypothetical protein